MNLVYTIKNILYGLKYKMVISNWSPSLFKISLQIKDSPSNNSNIYSIKFVTKTTCFKIYFAT